MTSKSTPVPRRSTQSIYVHTRPTHTVCSQRAGPGHWWGRGSAGNTALAALAALVAWLRLACVSVGLKHPSHPYHPRQETKGGTPQGQPLFSLPFIPYYFPAGAINDTRIVQRIDRAVPTISRPARLQLAAICIPRRGEAPSSSTTASHGSQPRADPGSRPSLRKITTAGSVLFAPAHASPHRPPPIARFAVSGGLDHPTDTSPQPASAQPRTETMDGKRHAASFQQLEKLGEGTYATVSHGLQPILVCSILTLPRSSKAATARRASWWR